MRPFLAGVSAGAALLLGGCGGDAGDLLAIEVSASPGEPARRLVVTGDGRGSCNRGELKTLVSERLIEARAVERDLAPLAGDGARFEAGRRPAAAALVARTVKGTVRWVEGGSGQPEVLPRATLLATKLERELC